MARLAVDADVHVVGVSTLGGGHKNLVPDVVRELAKAGRSYVPLNLSVPHRCSPHRDILVVVGGVIPPQDYDALYAAGTADIYNPGIIC